MPVNLKIWNAEQPPGSGRGPKGGRKDDVEWHAVTTLADGSEEWKSSDPVKEANGEGFAQRMYIQKWLRNDPDEWEWRLKVESARAKALEREQQLEKELARVDKRKTHNWEALAARRLMRTTVKRLAAAVNREMAERGAEVRAPVVTTRELRATFSEFLVDAEMDKSLSKPCEYRQWLWTDRNTVYLAPAGRRKRGGQGAGGQVTGSGKPN